MSLFLRDGLIEIQQAAGDEPSRRPRSGSIWPVLRPASTQRAGADFLSRRPNRLEPRPRLRMKRDQMRRARARSGGRARQRRNSVRAISSASSVRFRERRLRPALARIRRTWASLSSVSACSGVLRDLAAGHAHFAAGAVEGRQHGEGRRPLGERVEPAAIAIAPVADVPGQAAVGPLGRHARRLRRKDARPADAFSVKQSAGCQLPSRGPAPPRAARAARG